MARVLVLFHGRGDGVARLADAIADGARAVRFAEVDVRRLAPEPDDEARAPGHVHHRVLDDAAAAADYDAIVLGGPRRGDDPSPELRAFLERLAPLRAAGALTDRVGSAFVASEAGVEEVAAQEPALLATLAAMARLGMILVPPGQDASPLGPQPRGRSLLRPSLARPGCRRQAHDPRC